MSTYTYPNDNDIKRMGVYTGPGAQMILIATIQITRGQFNAINGLACKRKTCLADLREIMGSTISPIHDDSTSICLY
jgi:hypothetical protein